MRRLLYVLPLAVAIARLPAFESALPGYEYQFPRDHFAHRSFQTEWWYFTGNLRTADQRAFGFELTFFRVGTERAEPAESPWDIDEFHIAHFAVSDIAEKEFRRAERINRSGPGIAGASLDEARVWNGNWSVDWDLADPRLPTLQLRAVTEEAAVQLKLVAAKPAVVHGRDGISRKAEGVGRASHYISLTRLEASGTVTVGLDPYDVTGTAWMDHEFFTNSLTPEQIGWDWFSIQLDDGNDLMLVGMRYADGRHGPFSHGTFVGKDGEVVHLERPDFAMQAVGYWTSSDTGAKYPVEWTLTIPALDYDLRCRAQMDPQEMVSGQEGIPTYWEGAVTFSGQRRGEPVQGLGYLEMTGYAGRARIGPDTQPRDSSAR